MKIYTKTGDSGETALFGGERVSKAHPRVKTYGTLDEANSMLGLALSLMPKNLEPFRSRLTQIQNELFQIGSELASPKPAAYLSLIQDEAISRLETEIDDFEKSLKPLTNFILPGGASSGATLHVARTIARRAERECVELAAEIAIRPEVIRYLNRLSDYLFVIARAINQNQNEIEQTWKSKN